MSYAIHITRGREFESAGTHPISMRQWQSLLSGFRGVVPTADDPLQASLDDGDAHMVFTDGIIVVLRHRGPAVDRLKRIAARLGANIIGEDGQHLSLEAHEEVARVLAESGSNADASVLTPAQCEQLITVSDPMFSEIVRRDALSALGRLRTEQRAVGLSYLVCRAVECHGDPEETLTDAAALFFSAAPDCVTARMAAPTEAWAAEVQRRARRIQSGTASAAQGSRLEVETVIRVCAQCGAKNRLPKARIADGGRCGRCKSPLG